MLSEPATLKDVLQALSYGNREMILFVVGLMRKAFKGDLINIGVSLDAEDEAIYKHVKYHCRKSRSTNSYCTFYEEESDTTENPQALIQALLLNIGDAACNYRFIPAVEAQMNKLHGLLKAAVDNNQVPAEAYKVSCIEEEENLLLFDTLEMATEKVLQRTYYGLRHETAQGDGHILEWCNGIAAWIVHGYRVFAAEDLSLDANQIFLVGDKEYLTDLATKLPVLPLYRNSLEAKMRG